jgi:hypothetical protein
MVGSVFVAPLNSLSLNGQGLGPSSATTTQIAVVRVTTYEDLSSPYIFNEYNNYFPHNKTWRAMTQWCEGHGYPYVVVTDAEVISGSLVNGTDPIYPIAMIGNAPIINSTLASALNAYVYLGGHLFLWGDSGVDDGSNIAPYVTDSHTKGLYHFNGNAVDLSGNNRNLTSTTAIGYLDGPDGQAIANSNSSGTAQASTTGLPYQWTAGESLTCDITFRLDNYTGGNLVYFKDGVTPFRLSVGPTEDSWYFRVTVQDGTIFLLQFTMPIKEYWPAHLYTGQDTWVSVRLTYNITTHIQAVYFDGAILASQVCGGASTYEVRQTTTNFQVNPANKSIDELRISNIDRGYPLKQSALETGYSLTYGQSTVNEMNRALYESWFGVYKASNHPLTNKIITRSDLDSLGVLSNVNQLTKGPMRVWNITTTTATPVLKLAKTAGVNQTVLTANEYGSGEIFSFLGRMSFGSIQSTFIDDIATAIVEYAFKALEIPLVGFSHHPNGAQSSFGGLTLDMDDFGSGFAHKEDFDYIANLSATYGYTSYILGGGKFYSTSGQPEATTNYDNMSTYWISKGQYIGMHYNATHYGADIMTGPSFEYNWSGYWNMTDGLVGAYGPGADANKRYAAAGYQASTLWAADELESLGAIWGREQMLMPFIYSTTSTRNIIDMSNYGRARQWTSTGSWFDSSGNSTFYETPTTLFTSESIDGWINAPDVQAYADMFVGLAYSEGVFMNYYAHSNTAVAEYFHALASLSNLYVFSDMDAAVDWAKDLHDITISTPNYVGLDDIALSFSATAGSAITGATFKIILPPGTHFSSVQIDGARTTHYRLDHDDPTILYVWLDLSIAQTAQITVNSWRYSEQIVNLGAIIGIMMALGVFVSVLVPVVQVAQEKRKFKAQDFIHMVIYIIISVALLGVVYAVLP